MKEIIITYLPWTLSLITIWMFVLAGNKTKWAWLLGLVNQIRKISQKISQHTDIGGQKEIHCRSV